MIGVFDLLVLTYFVVLNAGYLALFVSAAVQLVARQRLRDGSTPEAARLTGWATLPISIVAPAYNEEATVVESVRALSNLRYPELEIIVVNDGSKDGTLARLVEAFELVDVPLDVRPELATKRVRAIYRSRVDRRLVVVDKENGGKADALNAGVNASRFPLVCSIDADTLMVPDALLRMVRPFMADDAVLAVGGTIRVANGCTIDRGHVVDVKLPDHPLARYQAVEYLRAFMMGRLGWEVFGGNVIISGAFGLFKRAAVVAAGGYRHDTVGEDMELVVRLRRGLSRAEQRRAVVHLPDPVCFTEVPESWLILGRQRDRWQRGLADTLWRHRVMILSPRYGAIGLFVLPFFTLFELLGPIVELLGYAYFVVGIIGGFVDGPFTLLFLGAAILFGFILSLGGILLEELSFDLYRRPGELSRLALAALLENFGYRQRTLWYRARGLKSWLTGNRAWGAMVRTGFGPAKAAAPKVTPASRVPRAAIAVLAVVLVPIIAWVAAPSAKARVVVLDRTVPFTDYREHRWLSWILTAAKVPTPDGRSTWDPERDYVGYRPDVERDELLTDAAIGGASLVYVADTYGVYTEDLRGRSDTRAALERSAKIAGGLDAREMDVIEAFVGRGGRVVAEFNTFASPTSADVRARLEGIVGVRWSGWIGRRFTALDDGSEVPGWMRRDWSRHHGGEEWRFTGPGVALVHEDTRVLVLREGVEVAKGAPVRLSAGDRDAPYDYWFDIVTAAPGAEVVAELSIDVVGPVPELDAAGVPRRFPGFTCVDACRHAYLSGDFADGETWLGPPWARGLSSLRGALAQAGLLPREVEALWLFYVPFVDRLVER